MKTMSALLGMMVLLAGCTANQGPPQTVMDKYLELSDKYDQGLGAVLNDCEKGGEKAYIVIGSGGFSGETFIYGPRGGLVQQYLWDDMVEPGETPPPFDSSQYECTTLNSSKSFGD